MTRGESLPGPGVFARLPAAAGGVLSSLPDGFVCLCLYLLILDLLAFAAFAEDKRRALKRACAVPVSRIRERTLLTLAALGGGGGAWLAMRLFRHKIRSRTFRICIPLFTLIWAAAAGLLLWLWG